MARGLLEIRQRVIPQASVPVFDFSYSLHILLLHLGAQVVLEWPCHHKPLRLILGRDVYFVGMGGKRREVIAILQLAPFGGTFIGTPGPVGLGVTLACCWRQIMRITMPAKDVVARSPQDSCLDVLL